MNSISSNLPHPGRQHQSRPKGFHIRPQTPEASIRVVERFASEANGKAIQSLIFDAIVRVESVHERWK